MKPLLNGNFTSAVLFRKESYLLLICIGLVVKVALFPVQTGDYTHYLAPWLHFIQTHVYAASLKFDFYNYTPAYIYILIGIARVGVYPLYAIKIVSVLFEYLMAYFIGKTVCLKYRNNIVVWISPRHRSTTAYRTAQQQLPGSVRCGLCCFCGRKHLLCAP